MYILKTYDYFSAAHQLQNYKGKCENLHGHNWKVEISVCGDRLNDIGILIDFHDLKSFLKKVLNNLDHKNLNDFDFFNKQNPSSEIIAKYIFNEISQMLDVYNKNNNTDIKVYEVSVWESNTSVCTYKE